MKSIKEIPISNIAVDSWHISPKAFNFAKEMENGALFPPIQIYKKDNQYVIKDGRNRITAAKLCGRKTIKCQINLKCIPQLNTPMSLNAQGAVKNL